MARQIAEWPLRYHQRALMGAYPVEMNARLILGEARVRLWDLETLNALLDLYGLDRIPLPDGISMKPAAPVEAMKPLILHRPSSIHQVAG